MSDMGCFYTAVGIENPALRGRVERVDAALVDTGSEFTWIPRELLASVGVAPERRQQFIVADGRTLVRSVGYALVHAADMTTADDVVFAEPGDLVLLGARSLEGLGLRVDPQRKTLVYAGPALAGALA